MALYKGAIIWRGDSGAVGSKESISKIQEMELWASWVSYVALLKAHSLCNAARSYRYRVDTHTPSAPGTGADVSVQATIYFRNSTTLEVLKYSYPAPLAAEMEDVGYGLRIKQSAVVDIVSHLSTIGNETYIPLYGVVRERV